MQGFALEKPMQRSSLLELKAKAEMQKMAIKDLLQGDREVLDSEDKYPCEMKERIQEERRLFVCNSFPVEEI